MPKGVEHSADNDVFAMRFEVMRSVMPKGVEHSHAPKTIVGLIGVMRSVMPKGVEHMIEQQSQPSEPE